MCCVEWGNCFLDVMLFAHLFLYFMRMDYDILIASQERVIGQQEGSI